MSSLNLFISHSHADEDLRQRLETHLKILERQGILSMWSDPVIEPGTSFKDEIIRRLRRGKKKKYHAVTEYFCKKIQYFCILKTLPISA